MGHNHSGCPLGNDICKDLPGVDMGFVDKTDRDHPDTHHLIGTIDGNTQKMLLVSVCIMLYHMNTTISTAGISTPVVSISTVTTILGSGRFLNWRIFCKGLSTVWLPVIFMTKLSPLP